MFVHSDLQREMLVSLFLSLISVSFDWSVHPSATGKVSRARQCICSDCITVHNGSICQYYIQALHVDVSILCTTRHFLPRSAIGRLVASGTV